MPSAPTSALLEAFINAGHLTLRPKSPVDITLADGTMPEIARQEFDVAANGESAIPALRAGCDALGLDHPAPDQTATEPDMICAGRWKGTTATVHARLHCPSGCVLIVETRIISF
ncbi:hypothetical protein ASF29_21960 [Rhizobium sp. Leaf262]|nr:hypothetical protein ASF29_21960 [Rhizobium sp. Leaf262]